MFDGLRQWAQQFRDPEPRPIAAIAPDDFRLHAYGQRPFLLTPLTGYRAFRVLPDGTLTGSVYRAEWVPGVNTAVHLDWGWTARAGVVYDEDNRPVHPKVLAGRHAPAPLDCICGFYAYYNNVGNPYGAYAATVNGVIEGWGVMTVGDRGFRAGKARLVALADDPEGLPAAAAAERYEVPWYPNRAEMLAAHPLTAPGDLPKPQVTGP